MERAQAYINSIFTSSTHFVPNTMATFLDLAWGCKKQMQFDPNVIAMVSQASGLFSVGALIIEEYITAQDCTAPSTSKRMRGVDSPIVAYWTKLAE